MKKLVCALLIMLPFIGISQNQQNGFAFFKNPIIEIKPSFSKSAATEWIDELPIYSEDDLKLYGGTKVLDMMYPVATKVKYVETINHNENPKVINKVGVSYSYLQSNKLPIYSEDDLKLYGGSKVQEMLYPTATVDKEVKTIHYSKNLKPK